jgi:acetyl-CoA acetyltransferase
MDVFVLGLAIYPARRKVTDERLEEMVFSVTVAALEDAGVERAEIEQVTLAACDELDGRSISSMLLAMPAGAYLRDEMKCTDSGLTGLCLGTTRLAAGEHGLGLVVSWNKSSVAPFEDVMRMRAEPFFTRPIGLNAAITDGLFAGAVAAAHGITEADATEAVLHNVKRAQRNRRSAGLPMPSAASIESSPYLATPLRAGHCAPRTDGGVAMVLASGDWLAQHPGHTARARIAGLGWSVDAYNLGGERLRALKSFRDATGRATGMAGIDSTALDVFELDCQTGFHAAAFAHALEGHDPATFSPSGGAFAQNPYFCAGLVNAAEAVLQVCGEAGAVQRPKVRWAAGHQTHGYAQQGNVVAVFEGA